MGTTTVLLLMWDTTYPLANVCYRQLKSSATLGWAPNVIHPGRAPKCRCLGGKNYAAATRIQTLDLWLPGCTLPYELHRLSELLCMQWIFFQYNILQTPKGMIIMLFVIFNFYWICYDLGQTTIVLFLLLFSFVS